jgi:uncharacterized protein (TIGR00255 family)
MNYERKLDFPKNEVQSSHNFPPPQTFAQKNQGGAETVRFYTARLALRAQTRSNSALCKSSAQKKSLRRSPRPFAYFCGFVWAVFFFSFVNQLDMLLSMTGYGRASGSFGEKTIMVEVRALNSKLTDLKLRLPGDYKEKEIEFRKLVTDHAERGKIDILVDVQNADGAAIVSLNEALFRGYHRELSRLSNELGIQQGEILQAILRIPNVVSSPAGEVDEDEWQAMCDTATRALDHLKAFRRQEGRVLEADLRLRITNILLLLTQVSPFEQERFVRMRERMRTNLEDNWSKDKPMDENRFEQEILFYLEKMDMSEEKTRLEQHCKYFLEQMDGKQESLGRTLNFISQEIGREINTLGAKAYDADIQRLVVQMKDELEKVKEQLANVL